MENNFLIQINDVAEAHDSDSQLFTHKEAIEIPFHRYGESLSKLVKDDISDDNTKNVDSSRFFNH